jgi:hypothetical protein
MWRLSLSNGVQIEFPKADVDRLFATMQQSAKLMDIEQGKAMKQAVGYLLRSLGASTRVAPKYREITASSAKPPRRNLQAFDVTGYFGKPRTAGTKTVFSRDNLPPSTFGNRGLAKLTWKLAGRDMGGKIDGMSFGDVASAITGKIAAQNVETKSSFTGPDIFAEIHNLLPYIRAAVKPGVINSAFERAARAMEHSIDNQLVKKMGLGRLSR